MELLALVIQRFLLKVVDLLSLSVPLGRMPGTIAGYIAEERRNV